MANMTFKTNLIPNSDLGFELGSSNPLKRWKIHGVLASVALDSTTLDNTAGNLFFSGSGEPWAGTDWVGLQVEGSSDKFQIHAYDGATLEYRQNDNGGTNSDGWGSWVKILSTGNYSSYLNGSYVTLTTDQNITGTKTWGVSGQGGLLNGAATNGGLNSIRVGDDVWLGDCNASGIMGMKSTSTNCGFYFYNSSGTLIGQLYSNGTNLISNKSLQIAAGDGSGIYYTGTKANYRMIRFIDNTGDTYGNGISIGGGGATIIGGGESSDQAVGQVGGGSEVMYICNDGAIEFFPNLQNG